MTATLNPPPTSGPPTESRSRLRVAATAALVVAAAGAGIGIGLAVSSPSRTSSAPTAASDYSYYQRMMNGYGVSSGGMMGGNTGWMAGRSGYGWMMGGHSAPGWMAGGTLPGFMMGSGTDPGEVMGRLFADAPGTRISAAATEKLATQIPAGATIDRAGNVIAFSAANVSYAVVASPSGADDKFETAGLTNPTITVRPGARVSVQFVNADTTSAHGYVVTEPGASASWMPMATSSVSFAGAASWFVGNATSAGDHAAAITFTASPSGSYQYLCPVPGHAQKGMAGTFTVSGRGV